MEISKVLMSYSPESIDVPLQELGAKKGHEIEIVISLNSHYEHINSGIVALLKHIVHNDKLLSIDISGVLKNLNVEPFTFNNANVMSLVRANYVSIVFFNKNTRQEFQGESFYLIGGAVPIRGLQDVLNKRLAPQTKEPNLTFFKGYPQLDIYITKTNSGLNYNYYERDNNYVVWQDIVKKPSDNIQRIVEECGIFIRWRNNWGGWSYWLFDDKYTEEIKTKSLGHFTRPYTNYESRTQRLFNFGLTSTKQWTLTSKVPVLENEKEEIKTIFISPEVYIYTGATGNFTGYEATTPENWERVTISAGSHKFQENEHATSSFSVTIEFQEIPTIKNI